MVLDRPSFQAAKQAIVLLSIFVMVPDKPAQTSFSYLLYCLLPCHKLEAQLDFD